MINKAITEFTNFLRSIPTSTRLIAIAAFSVFIIFTLVKFINKNVNKSKIVWLYFAFSVLSLIAVILLIIYR